MQWGLCIISLMGVLRTTRMMGISDNVARNGKAVQSSTHCSDGHGNLCHVGVPEKAIDGNRDSYFGNLSCTHTEEDFEPWWRVDLLRTYKVNNVTITNRNVHASRIDGAEIHIGNSLDNNGTTNPMCAVISHIKKGASKTFPCFGKWGQYVNIVIPNKTEYLTLCEVEVYGDESPLILVKENKTWGEALDYCREHHYDLASIHDEDTQTWAELEAMKADTPYMWLGLHYTCTLDFWFWVSGESSCRTNWAPGNGTGEEECGMTGAMERDGDNRWVARPDTERLNFICEEDQEEADSL